MIQHVYFACFIKCEPQIIFYDHFCSIGSHTIAQTPNEECVPFRSYQTIHTVRKCFHKWLCCTNLKQTHYWGHLHQNWIINELKHKVETNAVCRRTNKNEKHKWSTNAVVNCQRKRDNLKQYFDRRFVFNSLTEHVLTLQCIALKLHVTCKAIANILCEILSDFLWYFRFSFISFLSLFSFRLHARHHNLFLSGWLFLI